MCTLLTISSLNILRYSLFYIQLVTFDRSNIFILYYFQCCLLSSWRNKDLYKLTMTMTAPASSNIHRQFVTWLVCTYIINSSFWYSMCFKLFVSCYFDYVFTLILVLVMIYHVHIITDIVLNVCLFIYGSLYINLAWTLVLRFFQWFFLKTLFVVFYTHMHVNI